MVSFKAVIDGRPKEYASGFPNDYASVILIQ